MLRIFYGDDRKAVEKAVEKILGSGYEVVDGAELDEGMLMSLFRGGSLFEDTRRILIKDLAENKAVFEKIGDFVDTANEVVIWEKKIDKRLGFLKDLAKKIEIKEFAGIKADFSAVFDIYKTAKRDGVAAVKMLEKVEGNEDPFQFFGLLVSQALKDFSFRQGIKEKRVLLELSKVDIQMKSSGIEPWTLVKAFLIRLSSL